MADVKEILAKIDQLGSSYQAMVLILNSVSDKISELQGLAGSDTLDTIIQWQLDFNQQIKSVNDLIKQQYSLLNQAPCPGCPAEDSTPDMMDHEDMPMDMSSEQAARSSSPSDFLVVEDKKKPTTWHLQVKRNGVPDHNLMGGAWAALHMGYRGNKYSGPNKQAALKKLKSLYKSEGMPCPKE